MGGKNRPLLDFRDLRFIEWPSLKRLQLTLQARSGRNREEMREGKGRGKAQVSFTCRGVSKKAEEHQHSHSGCLTRV